MDEDDDLDAAFVCTSLWFRHNFAEFVCWTIGMLYETKTQTEDKFAYFFAGSDASVKISKLWRNTIT